GETVRTLLAALARQIRLADEAGQAVADRDLDAAVVDRGDSGGDDLALLQRGRGFSEVVLLQLLDAERDALLLDINVEQLHLHDVALLEVLHRFLARALPVEVGEMDHAVDLR